MQDGTDKWYDSPYDVFERWRESYDEMTWADQVEFYDMVATRWPSQDHYCLNYCLHVFKYITTHLEAYSVIEIGGWKGKLAGEILSEFPAISRWYNFEVSPLVVDSPVCKDERYIPVLPADFVWNVSLPKAEVLVTSHFLEHIKARDVRALFGNLPPSVLFMAHVIPILPDCTERDWTGYGGNPHSGDRLEAS